MLKINELNWSFCHFSLENCIAQINHGGDLGIHDEFQELFYVNVLKKDNEEQNMEKVLPKEIYQETFSTLLEALNYININFSHWKFINLLDEQSEKSGGCGSCVAH